MDEELELLRLQALARQRQALARQAATPPVANVPWDAASLEAYFAGQPGAQERRQEVIDASYARPDSVQSLLSTAQGATFGFSDELTAALDAAIRGADYGESVNAERSAQAQFREERPLLAAGTEMLGAVGTALATPLGAIGQSGSLLRQALLGGLTGGAMGATYGIGTGEGGLSERVVGAGDDALIGLGIGAAMPLVGRAVQSGWNALMGPSTRTVTNMAPALDDLRAQANALYAQADQVTGLPRGDFTTMANALAQDVQRQGMDDMLTPGAVRVMDNITDAATDPNATIGFREADILRRQAAIPAGNVANRTEASLGSMMIDGIDDFIENADPSLSGVLREARDTWGRLRRSELVDQAIDRASRAASGFENGLRVEFRRILNNPRLVRGFGDDELRAMQQVVQGTAFGNLLRQVGRLGIGLNGQSNALGATAAAILGGSLGGPVGSVVLPAIGTAAKAGANLTTRRAAEFARAVTAMGGAPAYRALTDQTADALTRNALAAGVGAALPLSQAY